MPKKLAKGNKRPARHQIDLKADPFWKWITGMWETPETPPTRKAKRKKRG